MSWRDLVNQLTADMRTPIEYEKYCQSLFRLEGWKSETTPQTGDQGADLICSYDTMRVVVQCKQYSAPVGNSAVQEALSARVFYGADKAIVVTNTGYTKSAQDLARKTLVELLLDSDIREWAKKQKRWGAPHYVSLDLEELIATLNSHGFAVSRTKNGSFVINTKTGPIHVATESAFAGYADTLLKKLKLV